MVRRRNQRAAIALAAAAFVHGSIFLLWSGGEDTARSTEPTPSTTPPTHEASTTSLSTVSLVAFEPNPAESVAGASDSTSEALGGSRFSRVVAPGAELGARAEGERGLASSSPRSDRAPRSSGLWNHSLQTQEMHATGKRTGTTTPESIERDARSEFSNRAETPTRARSGEEQDRAGSAEGAGQGGAPGVDGHEWLTADPRFDSAPKRTTQKTVGVASPQREAPRRDPGETASENDERGKATRWASAAELSNRARSSPFDLGAPSAGGSSGLGAGGATGKSVAAQGDVGTASQSRSETGSGKGATHATRTHPYFYAMYRRIDKELEFPRELALALEQGEVVLRFRLDANGKVHDLRIDKKSEFRQFDSEAVRAFRAAAPFGPVPRALLAGRGSVNVIAPYYFRNPLIR